MLNSKKHEISTSHEQNYLFPLLKTLNLCIYYANMLFKMPVCYSNIVIYSVYSEISPSVLLAQVDTFLLLYTLIKHMVYGIFLYCCLFCEEKEN